MPMIQRLSMSLGLTLNWGVRMETQKSDLFKEITYVEEVISNFRSTTGNLQDYIPLLRLNPLSSESERAKEMRGRRDIYMHRLDQDLEDRMEKGIHKPCIQANVRLDKEAKLNQVELTSINLSMLAGGLDTITSAMSWGIACLANHPEVQEKAWKAISEFYSTDEPLCDAKDDQNCTYVVALIKEIFRFLALETEQSFTPS